MTLRKSSYTQDSIQVLLIALPGLFCIFLFKYVPMAGNIIAFKDYNLFQGIWGSPWVGMDHFVQMFSYHDFIQVFINSLRLGLYSIVFGFPAPLILALL